MHKFYIDKQKEDKRFVGVQDKADRQASRQTGRQVPGGCQARPVNASSQARPARKPLARKVDSTLHVPQLTGARRLARQPASQASKQAGR